MDLPVWAPATSMAALPLVRLCSSSPMYTISSAGLNMLNLAPFANTCASHDTVSPSILTPPPDPAYRHVTCNVWLTQLCV